MITLNENIVGIWYVQTTDTQDWMCGVSQLGPERFEVNYRFRYYDGDQSKNSFECGDTKNWYSGSVSGSREFVLGAIRGAVALLKKNGAIGEVYEYINYGDIDAFMREFKQAPFVHTRTVSKEEAAQYVEADPMMVN